MLRAWARQEADYVLLGLDPQGIVVAASPATERVLGYAPREIAGRPLSIIFVPEDIARGAPAHELAVARATGHSEDDRWHVRKDGQRVWVDGLVTALYGQRGEVTGFVKVMRDRTDMRLQLDTLTHRVMALRSKLDAKEAFIKMLVHEIANPLGPLHQAVQRLVDAPDEPESGRLHRLALRQADALVRLLADVRATLAREESEQPAPLRMERIDLNELLARQIDAAQFSAREHGVQLALLVPSSPIEVEVDTGRLQQIVNNLVANAIKYTPASGHVWVMSSVEDEYAVIRVEDDGVGIAPDMLPRIFQLFTQEAASRHLSEGGMGVGLAVVRDLVERHHGTVEVRSDGRDKGSSFLVRLPLKARWTPPAP
jgi:two-component system CheB/CheR fusion protein